MLDDFARSTRALGRDVHAGTLAVLALLALLMAGWLGWFLFGRVQVYEVSDAARLELARAVHAIESPLAGRVVTNDLVLDREVEAGEVLVALDVESTRLRLEEERTRLASLAPQLEALDGQIAAQESALREDRGATVAALEEARAQAREAESAAAFAEQELKRLQRLHVDGQISDAQFARAQTERDERRAAAEGARLAVDRLERERTAGGRDREARLQQLRLERTRLEADVAAATATIESLEHAVEERFIRAPVRGRVVEAADLEAGAFVDEGDRLGVVMADGRMRAVADYPPSAALGRIRPGQEARLRLEGFPWAQYGTVRATVAGVASELRDGTIRVELDLKAEGSAIPLQHGLPGSVEVEIERVSPATLALRAAGRLLASPADPGS